LLRLANYQLKQLHGTVIKTTRKRTKTKPDIENNSVRILRAGFKGGGANWAVAQGPLQLRGLHKKNSKKILPKET